MRIMIEFQGGPLNGLASLEREIPIGGNLAFYLVPKLPFGNRP